MYGHGGVKLLPTDLTIAMDISTTDMTTSISEKFKAENRVSNITAFNTDEYSTWRSAFRECVKLSSKVIDKNYKEETEKRLEIWCTTGKDALYGKFSIGGARCGFRYGVEHIGNKEKLSLINDFDWIRTQFLEWKKTHDE